MILAIISRLYFYFIFKDAISDTSNMEKKQDSLHKTEQEKYLERDFL